MEGRYTTISQMNEYMARLEDDTGIEDAYNAMVAASKSPSGLHFTDTPLCLVDGYSSFKTVLFRLYLYFSFTVSLCLKIVARFSS